MNEITKRLKKVIDDSHLTFMELENQTGISKSTLQRYASGKTEKIPINCIEEIAKATGVSAAYIMGWEQSKNMNTQTDNISENQNPNINIQNHMSQANILQDEMTVELVKAFQSMNFIDKMEIMNIVLEKTLSSRSCGTSRSAKSKKSKSPIQQKTYSVRTAAQHGSNGREDSVFTRRMTTREIEEILSAEDGDEDL